MAKCAILVCQECLDTDGAIVNVRRRRRQRTLAVEGFYKLDKSEQSLPRIGSKQSLQSRGRAPNWLLPIEDQHHLHSWSVRLHFDSPYQCTIRYCENHRNWRIRQVRKGSDRCFNYEMTLLGFIGKNDTIEISGKRELMRIIFEKFSYKDCNKFISFE